MLGLDHFLVDFFYHFGLGEACMYTRESVSIKRISSAV